jgi:ADP-ribosylglycohydrolase
MLGVIAGDVIGSVFEFRATKTPDFELFHPLSSFTDDTVLTLATAHAILTGTPYDAAYRTFGLRYPNAGYGAGFKRWLLEKNAGPYNSWGNGSAMRVAPIGIVYDDEDSVMLEAERSAAVSHNHPEGIKGAQAVALGVWMARSGASKQEIRDRLTTRFAYDLTRSVEAIRVDYHFDVSCQGSVPQAISAFLEADSVEHAIRLAVSLGGDSDTQAAIAGGLAHAFYGNVPEEIARPVLQRLPEDLLEVLRDFQSVFPVTRRRAT